MPGKTALITGCDRRYFPLLQMFVTSVADAGALDHVDLAMFDLDFSESEKAWLADYATAIEPARSPLGSLLPSDDGGRRTLPSLIRPFLPDVFPGYDIYVYSDVDVWVQDWRGFELFIEGAARGKLAICPQVDRSYFHNHASIEFRFKLFSGMFGAPAARTLVRMPHMNGGIFAARADAPHWQLWARAWRRALETSQNWFGSGQAILTHLVYNEHMPAELLPAICNWQSHLALPLWDEAARCFVEPHLPHQKILLMHMTDDTKWLPRTIRTLQGNVIEKAELRYDYYKKLRDGAIAPASSEPVPAD